MGMDLVPRKKDVEGLHFNWHGWQMLQELLDALGMDTNAYMRFVNDGDYIPAATCRLWANTLNDALQQDLIKGVKVIDKNYWGGCYIKLVPEAKSNKKKAKPLDDDDREWLKGVAAFFGRCGGCRQY